MYVDPSLQFDKHSQTSVLDKAEVALDFVENQESDELQTADTLRVFLNELALIFEVEHLDKALYRRAVDVNSYKEFLQQALQENSICAQYFHYSLDVKLAQGERQDIMIVDVEITKRLDKAEDFVPIQKRFIV